MALNQVILEGQLASIPQKKGDMVEFFLAQNSAGKVFALFPVEIWRCWARLLDGVNLGDPILVLGQLRGFPPSEMRIDATLIQRLKGPRGSEVEAGEHRPKDRPLS